MRKFANIMEKLAMQLSCCMVRKRTSVFRMIILSYCYICSFKKEVNPGIKPCTMKGTYAPYRLTTLELYIAQAFATWNLFQQMLWKDVQRSVDKMEKVIWIKRQKERGSSKREKELGEAIRKVPIGKKGATKANPDKGKGICSSCLTHT